MGPKGFLPLGFVFSRASKSLKKPTRYLYSDTNKKISERRQRLKNLLVSQGENIGG